MKKVFKNVHWLVLITALLTVADASADELVTNGNFELGNTGFSSDYTFVLANTSETQYGITTDPQLFGGIFASFGDHTTGSGNMMVVNGSTDTTKRFWFQQINVVAGQQIDFSFFAANMHPNSPANLVLDLDGSQLSTLNLAGFGLGEWAQLTHSFTPGVSGISILSLRTDSGAFNGDDFAVDDISAISAVPEPSSFSLACIAGIGVFLRRSKRRS